MLLFFHDLQIFSFAAGHAPVGSRPGVTVSIQNRIKISQDPPVFIYDTPGILTPTLPNTDAGMKLALCGKLTSLNILVE